VLRWLGIRLLIWGFLACHVFNTLFYEWDRFVEDPLLMLKVWDGISSWGGVIGGSIALYVYTGMKGLDRLRWADMGAYGAIGGWVPGRAACAIVHDHVGYPTDFALGVDFPGRVDLPGTVNDVAGRYPFDRTAEHVIRAHDLGLYETLILLPIFVAVVLLERWKGRKPGFLVGFLAVTYTIPRFFLEFLRRPETDPRHFGLTFAQYCCIAGLVGGIWLLARPRSSELAPATVVDRKAGADREPPAPKARPAGKPTTKKKRK
jgi:phosphatidylglycerol---prolipoprotein diacylglyceryl transferase